MNSTQSYPRTIDSGTGEVITFAGQVVYPLRGEVLQAASEVDPGKSRRFADAPAPLAS